MQQPADSVSSLPGSAASDTKTRPILIANSRWQQSVWIYVFFALLSIAIISPVSSNTAIPNLGDYIYHLAAIIQAKAALLQGQYPLRTMPFEHNGAGYPLYQFFSPSTYTFAGLIYWLLTPNNPLVAFTIVIWCGLMLAGISMYQLAYWFIRSKPAAILAGVAYLCAPYYIIIIDHLGSLPEILALGILPGVFYLTLQRYYYPTNSKILLMLSLGWYLLFTIHIATAIYASLLFAILLLMPTIKNKKRWRNLLAVGIAYALGVMMACWYLLPAAMFSKFFMLSNTYSNGDYIAQYHPLLSNLLFPAASLTNGYQNSALMSIHPAVGLPILAACGICLYAFFNKLSCGRKRAEYWLPGLLTILMIAFFLAWSPINIWPWLPKPLYVVQHCWRILGHVMWIGALLFSWAVYWLFKGKLDARHILLGTVLIILCVNPWFRPAENFATSLSDFIKNPHLIYNSESMLINYNQYPYLVKEIDSMQVDASNLLRSNVPYMIPESLIKLALNPVISIRGKTNDAVELTALVNNKAVAVKKLPVGEFSWNIPLQFTNGQSAARLDFIAKNNKAELQIPTQEFILSGFIKNNEILTLKQIGQYCTRLGAKVVCQIDVPDGVRIVELPQLYYPNLLTITLNGKPVVSQGIINQGKLVTMIAPQPGIKNEITMQFTGLAAANYASWLGWGLWLFLVLETLLSCGAITRFNQRRKSV